MPDISFPSFDISTGTIVFWGILIFALIAIKSAIKIVPQGYNYTIERFGKYRLTLTPGLNLIVPLFDKVGHEMNMMEQVFDIPAQEVITKDNASIQCDGVAFYQIVDASKAGYEVSNLYRAILNLTMTNLRAVVGSMDLDKVLSDRKDINEKLLNAVNTATTPWGIKITRIEIKDVTPPEDLVRSMNRQMQAERDKRAKILVAEGERQAAIEQAEGKKKAAILKAEGEKESAILEANGRKEAAILVAEGEKQAAIKAAEAREREGEAEAKATEVVSNAIKEGEQGAIQYFVAQKYVDAMYKIGASENSKTVLMPMDSSGVIGSVGAIGELFKDLKAS